MDIHFHPTPRGHCIHVRISNYPAVTIEAATEGEAYREALRLVPMVLAALKFRTDLKGTKS